MTSSHRALPVFALGTALLLAGACNSSKDGAGAAGALSAVMRAAYEQAKSTLKVKS